MKKKRDFGNGNDKGDGPLCKKKSMHGSNYGVEKIQGRVVYSETTILKRLVDKVLTLGTVKDKEKR